MFLPLYRCISSSWEPPFSILFSSQESVQVDLWSLCDLWSTVRRKKRHTAAQLGSGSIFRGRSVNLIDNWWPSEIGNIVRYPLGICYSPNGWQLVWVYFSYYFKLGCMFNLILSGLHTTRVFVSTVPLVWSQQSQTKKLSSSMSKTVLAHVNTLEHDHYIYMCVYVCNVM